MTNKDKDIQLKVGDRIRQIREKKNFTQAELAEKGRLNRTFLIHIEKGRRNVSLKSLEKILYGLDTSFGDFFKRI